MTARAFPILPLDDVREPTEAERLDLMTEHVHDVVSENARLRRQIDDLERDNTSLRSRTRTMEGVLFSLRPRAQDFAETPLVLGVYGQGQMIEQLVVAAQTLDALGDLPAIRFARNAADRIVGVELASLPGRLAAGPIERLSAEMSVVGDDA